MILLIIGLLIWIAVHFIPSVGINYKRKWVEQFGQQAYTAAFSLLIILSLVFIVFGWRSTTPSYIYYLPAGVKHFSFALIFIAFILFGAAKSKTRIKQFIRHPQLVGLILWSTAHLLLNGDSRSVVLFSGLGIWAFVEIMLINKRSGQWVKPAIPSWGQEIKGHLISMVILVVIVFLHPYIAGVAIR